MFFLSSLTSETGLKILKARSEIMQKQSEAVPSGLLTVFIQHNSELRKAMLAAREWCSTKLQLQVPVVCEISNYLFADCKVIGGNKEVSQR